MMQQRGFTLVELSIVLVIIGLLVGGVLTGQSLIRAAELRATTAQYQRYVAAVNTFRDKYFALPGDMTNATAYWGTDPGGCPATENTVPKIATCNGDGNGQLFNVTAANEPFRFWQHLADAGLIEGQYSGTSATSASTYIVANNLNVPAGKIGSSLWTSRYLGAISGDTVRYTGTYGNHFQLGLTTASNSWNDVPFLKPEDAYNIDVKLDDGKPATGGIVSNWNNCTSSASATDYTGTYQLGTTTVVCFLHFFYSGAWTH